MDVTKLELKRLSDDAIDAALDRALHYRYLNQPHLAESICRDILAARPEHEQAGVTLIMSLCDQFATADAIHFQDVLAIAGSLDGAYERAYYSGLIHERRAEAALHKGGPAAGAIAYGAFRRAMDYYAVAEPIRPPGNDDALLRWNTCVRIINARKDVRPREDEGVEMLE